MVSMRVVISRTILASTSPWSCIRCTSSATDEAMGVPRRTASRKRSTERKGCMRAVTMSFSLTDSHSVEISEGSNEKS